MDVQIYNLRRYFGKTRAVDGISFGFNRGEIYGFVGPNGAGKTTTMRILATLDEPTTGDIWVNGHSVVQDPEKIRREVGFMPDALPAHRDITVHEYLDFYARAYGIHDPKRTRLVAEIEEFTNLVNIREKRIAECSKGMKQRVSLARAIIHEPTVLVLDEPAAGLDPRARVELRELLKILAEQGKAILISSHILTELAEIVDGVIFIERGQLLHAGTIQDISQKVASDHLLYIRSLDDDPSRLHKTLLETPHVGQARIAGREVIVELDGGDAEAAELLTWLVGRGFSIAEFRHHQAHLEDLFMNITKGTVQ